MGKRKDRRGTQSGAVGGPGTGAGLNFQANFAVLHALDAISHALVDPLIEPDISMEPRVLTGSKVATAWDVKTSHPKKVAEAKLRPKSAEVFEWLDRIEVGLQQDDDLEFELFVGRGAGAVLSEVERLCRIAQEASGNEERFMDLVRLEHDGSTPVALQHLKFRPHRSFSRIRVTQLDPNSLVSAIDFRLRLLTGDADRKRLNDLLYSKFHRGIQNRETWKIRALMHEADEQGIVLFTPPTFEPNYLEPLARGTIYLLQHCENGLPSEVLAAAVDCANSELDSHLSKYVERRIMRHDGGLWMVTPIKQRITYDRGSIVLGRALRQLLEYIKANKSNLNGKRQIPNAITLAKACSSCEPELVAGLFWKLDKLMKNGGNKRLALEVANLSIAAARRAPRTDAQTRGEAVALICGRSWVYQRINRLDDARADGLRSLELGKELGWDRNTAYCLKCLGRLSRMEAERQHPNSAEFTKAWRASLDYLHQAISVFPNVSELPAADRTAEVGDCYSLLGRTHLVAGDVKAAAIAAQSALDRISDKTSKDYADLQILFGDLASARGDKVAAESHYDEAIEVAGTLEAERSEIAARAHFQKGRLLRSAVSFGNAADIWADLEEPVPSDNARWHSVVLSGDVPKSAVDILKVESPSVRMETIRLHQERLSALPPARGRRSEPDKNYWIALIPDAKRNVAVRQIPW
jgi:tetratricopeptide (TPR) repeat protein